MIGIGVGVGIGGGAAPWSPLSMAPSALVDGTVASTFALNGAQVEQWSDLGSSANHLTQSNNALRPSLAGTTVTWTRAEGDYMLFPTALPSVVAGWYVAIVGSLAAESATQQVLWTDYGVGASGAQINVTAGNELVMSHPSSSAMTCEASLVTDVLCREFGYDGANMKYRVNGGAWTSAARAAPLAYNGAQRAAVGAYHSGGQPTQMTLKYMEVICGRWPSAAELSAHRAYMLAKFGV